MTLPPAPNLPAHISDDRTSKRLGILHNGSVLGVIFEAIPSSEEKPVEEKEVV